MEWGNGLADRAADQPEGRLEYGSVTNPITPVKWWSALPGRMPEELTDTLSRNVRRMSQETDTAEYLWRRQDIKAGQRQTGSGLANAGELGLAGFSRMEGAPDATQA